MENTFLKRSGYSLVGAGNLAIEKTRDVMQRATSMATRKGRKSVTKDVAKAYEGLVERGERIIGSIQRSVPVKRAGERTKNAQRQVKGAVTSVKRAAGAQGAAVKASAKKVG